MVAPALFSAWPAFFSPAFRLPGDPVTLSSRARAGFTLVELVVAMAVSLILIVSLLQIFNTATKSWQQGEAEADAFREARGALQLMARDLSATVEASYAQLPAGGTTATAVTPLVPTLVLNRYSAFLTPDPPQTDPSEAINEEVYCLTNVSSPPATVSPTPSPSPASIFAARELCAVGYFCQWLPDVAPYKANPSRAPAAYGLMRQYLNGDGTFLRFQEAHSAGSASSPLSFAAIYSRAQVSLLPSAAPAADLAQSSLLASYIFDLKFRIDTNLVVSNTYDDGEASPPVDHSSPTQYPYSDAPPLPLPPQLPTYVEIRFKALSANIGRRLEGNTSVTPGSWVSTTKDPIYKTLILPHSEQFVLRVPLINSAPPATTPAPGS